MTIPASLQGKLRQVRQFFDGALILAGAMSTDQDVLAAQGIGADFAYLGTRFLASKESGASDQHKGEVIASRAEDIIYTNIFTGILGNYLKSTRWRAGLVVKNLTDERAMGYVMNVPIFSGARVASIIPPRTFGFSVTLNY